MRRVLILTREDLSPTKKLVEVKNVTDEVFSLICQDQMPNFEVVLFYCNLTDETKTLKNRYGHHYTVYSNSNESTNKSKLLDFIMIGDDVK